MPVSSFSPATAGPLEDAIIAIYRGDNENAVRLLRPLAEQGDARAQYNLGTLYFTGGGVSRGYAEALKWFRLSADRKTLTPKALLVLCTTRVRGCLRTMFWHICDSICRRLAGASRLNTAPNDARTYRRSAETGPRVETEGAAAAIITHCFDPATMRSLEEKRASLPGVLINTLMSAFEGRADQGGLACNICF